MFTSAIEFTKGAPPRLSPEPWPETMADHLHAHSLSILEDRDLEENGPSVAPHI